MFLKASEPLYVKEISYSILVCGLSTEYRVCTSPVVNKNALLGISLCTTGRFFLITLSHANYISQSPTTLPWDALPKLPSSGL